MDVWGLNLTRETQDAVLPRLALPDTIRLTSIHLPRATIVPSTPMHDIDDDREKYIGEIPFQSMTTPQFSSRNKVFPEHLSNRRLSSIDVLDIQQQNAHSLSRQQISSRSLISSDQFIMNTDRSAFQHLTDLKLITTRALFRNSSLSYQRFVFTMTKFPALVLVIVALCSIAGNRETIILKPTERGAHISALITGGIILISQVLLLHQHNNCYKKAKIMSYLYHITMMLAFITATISIVLAAVSIKPVKETNVNEEKYVDLRDRLNYLATILIAAAVVVIFSLTTMIYGVVGQSLMKKKFTEEYQKSSRVRAYESALPQY